MPDEKNRPPKTPRSGARKDPLKEFQDAILSFVNRVPQAALKAVGNDPDAHLIEANATMIQNMFKKSFVKINREAAKISTVQLAEVTDFLEVTDGINMVRVGEKTAVSAFSAKLFGGSIWQWIGQHLTEIKKIVGMILGLFSKKLKEWWDKISVIIDELWNILVSILGGIFGANRMAVAKELSNAEVNYLNEMAALTRLQSASSRDETDED